MSISPCQLTPDSSYWVREGTFISFAECRFVIKGRLTFLPNNIAVKRPGKPHTDTICQKCKLQPETFRHVLNVCTPNAGLMTERQNALLQWLSRTIPGLEGDKYLNQKVKNAPGDLQPTLMLWHRDRQVSIVNVTVPYEGDTVVSLKIQQSRFCVLNFQNEILE